MSHARGRSRTERRAGQRLADLFPPIGPWTSAALWFGRVPLEAPPTTPLADELEIIADQRLATLALKYVAASGADISTHERVTLQQSAFAWSSLTHEAIRSAPSGSMLAHAVVSKGPGIASHYPRTNWRPFSDIDVLVTPAAFDGHVRQLESAGWFEELRNRQPWQYFRRFCREGLNLVHADGGRVDVHHRIPPWIWSARLDIRAMAQRVVPVSVAGVELRCLDAADNLLIAALHVVSDRNKPGRSLLVWRDIVELVNASPTAVTVERAAAANLTAWLRAVLQALPNPMGSEELVAALPADAPFPQARRLALLLSRRFAPSGVLGTQFLRLPLLNGVAFVVGMLVPSPTFLRDRFPDVDHRYRRWWRHAVHRHESIEGGEPVQERAELSSR